MPFAPPGKLVSTTSVAAIAIAAYVACRSLIEFKSRKSRREILAKSPPNLVTWRQPPGPSMVEAEEAVWNNLDMVLREAGFTQWPHRYHSEQISPGETHPLPHGYAYISPLRNTTNPSIPGTADQQRYFEYINPLNRAVRTKEGYDGILRIIVVKNQGHSHLNILRKLGTGPDSLLSNNHTLPLLREFEFEHLIFGLFPKVGHRLIDAYHLWAYNSVGDIIDMVMQALEGLAYIHGQKIAHRDAFKDNFLVQWHPESARSMTVPISRPRVYLVDFEVAVSFDPDRPLEECVCTGYPSGGSFFDISKYARSVLPEMVTGEPYDPFKLDVWQLGDSLLDFKSEIEPIDQVLMDMTAQVPALRLDANDALSRLSAIVNSMPPSALLNPPLGAVKYSNI